MERREGGRKGVTADACRSRTRAVRGREADGTTWEEVTSCVDVSLRGVRCADVAPGQHRPSPAPLGAAARALSPVRPRRSHLPVYALVRTSARRECLEGWSGVPGAETRRRRATLLAGRALPGAGGPPCEAPRGPRPLLRLRLEAGPGARGVAAGRGGRRRAPRTAVGARESDGACRSAGERSWPSKRSAATPKQGHGEQHRGRGGRPSHG